MGAVDPYTVAPGWATAEVQQQSYEHASKLFAPFNDRARIWRMDSAAAARSLVHSLGGADVVFIDAAHEFCMVRVDLEAWVPHVIASHGMLVGHDWTWGAGFPGGPGVAMAASRWHAR